MKKHADIPEKLEWKEAIEKSRVYVCMLSPDYAEIIRKQQIKQLKYAHKIGRKCYILACSGSTIPAEIRKIEDKNVIIMEYSLMDDPNEILKKMGLDK